MIFNALKLVYTLYWSSLSGCFPGQNIGRFITYTQEEIQEKDFDNLWPNTHWLVRLKSCKDHRQKVTKFQISLKNEDLFRKVPEELKDLKFIFEEIENLEFDERPQYEKVITFIKNHEHFGKVQWLKLYTRS